jgi:hypothetical protein
MSTYLKPQNLYNAALLIIVAVGAIATWYNSRASKQADAESEALNTIKLKDERISELTKKITTLETRDVETGKEIAILKADRDRLEKIVANYNPSLEAFIQVATESLTNIGETNKVILESIHMLLKSQPPA